MLRTGSAYLFFAELLYSIVYSARWVSMGLNHRYWYSFLYGLNLCQVSTSCSLNIYVLIYRLYQYHPETIQKHSIYPYTFVMVIKSTQQCNDSTFTNYSQCLFKIIHQLRNANRSKISCTEFKKKHKKNTFHTFELSLPYSKFSRVF